MTVAIPVYDEIAAALASMAPAKILSLRPSETAQLRLRELLMKNRNGVLSAEEQYELDRMLALDHLIALAKAHARARLAQ
ncbi:MAG: hypothetical protein ACKVU2_06545 [Saprospiraceae bacterium]